MRNQVNYSSPFLAARGLALVPYEQPDRLILVYFEQLGGLVLVSYEQEGE